MNQPNRQPDLHDEQAVIAAVQLLVRSMKPGQREKLLSTLVHEQEENVQAVNYGNEENVGSEVNSYPIQPLMLASDDGQRVSSESTSETVSEEEIPSERTSDHPHEFHYEEGGSEPQQERPSSGIYAASFLPFTSSFSRRQWWTRLALGAIFLFLLSLSTLASYRVGVHAAMVNAAQAPCQSSYTTYIIMGRGERHFSYWHRAVDDNNGDGVTWQLTNERAYSIVSINSDQQQMRGPQMSWNHDGMSQCSTNYPISVFPHPHDSDDN
jgi:hypothetical protein